jgi:glycosyltransferase involved in cell wall biosynthesis
MQVPDIDEHVVPIVLTLNEEPNLGRTLDSLRWARRVIVLDSGSTDRTEEIARAFPTVEWRTRKFDDFKGQWRYGLTQLGPDCEYVLALDADMAVPENFVREMKEEFLPRGYAGGIAPFDYRLEGHPLASSLCGPQIRIFRPDAVTVNQPGHGHEFIVDGPIYRFRSPLIHDDRKPLERWIGAQVRYSEQEASRLGTSRLSRLQDRLRVWGLMPPVVAAMAYLRAGGPLRGAAAARYAYERATYECLLGIRLMNRRLEQRPTQGTEPRPA